MARFTCTMTVWHSGERHAAGEAISLSAADAAPLLSQGAIQPVARADKAAPAEAAPQDLPADLLADPAAGPQA